jgi:hypothetical protein
MSVRKMKNLLGLFSGVDIRLFNQAEAGQTAWETVGLNVLISSLLTGFSAALAVILVFPELSLLLYLLPGLTVTVLSLIIIRKILHHVLPALNKSLYYLLLTLILFAISGIISIPLEASLVIIAEPGKMLLNNKSVFAQSAEWFMAANGPQSLFLLRITTRTFCFLIYAMPFFVGWNARRGTLTELCYAEQELKNILTSRQ